MGSPDLEYDRGYSAIYVYMQALFNYARSLDAADWQIHAGMGFYVKTPITPSGMTDTARAKDLGLGTKYVALVQTAPAASSDGQGGVTAFKFCRNRIELADKTRVHAVPSFYINRRADLVLDDATELLASEFPYTNVATTMGDSLRQRVYGGSLSAVKPPVDTANGGFFDNGSSFYAMSANGATYDTAAPGQPYYQKWIKPNPASPKDRAFKLDLLGDRYLQLNCIPYDLQKGFVHLYLELGDIAMLVRLYFDEKGRLRYDGMELRGMPQVDNYFQYIATLVQKLKAQKQKVKGNLSFIYSLDGTSDRPPAFAQLKNVVSSDLSLNVLEQVVDPKWVVQSSRGRKLEDIDLLQRTWTARDWLREMVRLRFSEPWVWFWKNADIERFYQIDRDKLFLTELRGEAAKATGPVKQTLDDYIKTANADPTMYMVKRGSGFGKGIKVVGTDDAYIYFYNNSLGIVTRLPMASFWALKDLQQIAGEIYQNTKGLIPFCKVVVWGGLIVMAWGVVSTEVLVEGFQAVRAQVRGREAREPRPRQADCRNVQALQAADPGTPDRAGAGCAGAAAVRRLASGHPHLRIPRGSR